MLKPFSRQIIKEDAIKRRAFSILKCDKNKRAADFIGAHSIDVTALEWEPFSKRGFEQIFPILFFKKGIKKEKGKPTPAFLAVLRWLLMDFGLVSLLVNLNDPFHTGFGITIDFFVALLFNELISDIVERPNKRVNAGRRRLCCHRLCHYRLCRLHRRGNSYCLLSTTRPAGSTNNTSLRKSTHDWDGWV